MYTYREKLEQNFQKEYDKLNAHQRSAVDTIEGPVMVIAGPGTGKTQILAARIGKILLDTDIHPDNILCLTYTDAGAIAMRRRLLDFIGPDAYRVNIHTFHSFCHNVIQHNLSVFRKNSLSPVSELESVELFKKLIDTLPPNHPLKRYRGDEYYEIGNLQSLFSVMKREGWTPEFLNTCIDEYIKSLPERETYIYKRAGKNFKKGDLKMDDIREETDKMEKLRAAVNEFPRFRMMMDEARRYDFDDMITWVIRAFEENPNLLSQYQERFQYVLVDEYQDTSGTQNRLVELLINYWDKPNVFVVGDDDQSIFRFQGANVENMMDFRRMFADDLSTVVLTHNYRSSQPILDVSKSVIDRNEERLINKIQGLSKELLSAGDDVKHLTHPPVIREYHSEKDELAGIAADIESLITRGVSPGHIAVIYREHKYGLELSRYLRLSGIPVYSRKTVNLLEEPFARKIFKLLRYVKAELEIPYSGDSILFEIMHYDFFGIPPIEAAKLAADAADRKTGGPLRKKLLEKTSSAQADLFENKALESLSRLSVLMEKLVGDAPNVPLQKFFEEVVYESGILSYVVKNEMRHYLMQILTSLFDFVKDETARNPYLDLKGIIRTLDLMIHQKISLPMAQVTGNEKGVNLLTAHGCKGLEFEYVFVAGTISSYWEGKSASKRGYRMPDNIFRTLNEKTDTEEQRRLFYVALTRAEQSLTVSYYQYDNNEKEQEPSLFIAELLEGSGLKVEKPAVDEELRFKYSLLQFNNQAPEIEKAEEDFIAPLVEKFQMNVTALNNYLECPLNFYYNSLLHIPSSKSEAAVFGSAVHHALDQLFKKMQDNKSKTGKAEFPPIASLFEDFSNFLKWNRQCFTDESFAKKLEYGQEILTRYYEKYAPFWNRAAQPEYVIPATVVNGIPLKGMLDKVEMLGGGKVNVVDYKTGDPDKSRAKLKGPDEKNPHGGNYWRQAVFYKLLLDSFKRGEWNVVSTEFDFVEPDKRKELTKHRVDISEADIETVKQQISTVWQKVKARDFYTGCGKTDCRWCNFVKDNKIAIALHELQEEEI